MLALAGCASDASPGPSVKVMTWNVYIGGDVSGLARAGTSDELADAASQLFERVQSNDFRDRASAIASRDAVIHVEINTWGHPLVAATRAKVTRDEGGVV